MPACRLGKLFACSRSDFPYFGVNRRLALYVQHTFEDSYFEADEHWNYVQAAVEGSSYYKLPKLLQWLTGNIGYHHVHHLSPKVPNYKLEAAHEGHEPLKMYRPLRLKQVLNP